MTVSGGTKGNWYMTNFDGAEEYREVSTDGSEDNTKQQSRGHNTLVRERITDSKSGDVILSFSTNEGTEVTLPAFAKSWGGILFTASGTWVIVSHQFSMGPPGGSKLLELQVLKKFQAWADV